MASPSGTGLSTACFWLAFVLHPALRSALLDRLVDLARRAWCGPEDILNTRDVEGVLAFARRKRERAGA